MLTIEPPTGIISGRKGDLKVEGCVTLKYMSAGVYNLKLEKGTTIEVPFVYGRKVGEAVVPYDVTGWTARMQIRESVAASAILAEFTTENGGLEVDGPAGEFKLLASAAQSTAWNFTAGVYDLEIVDTLGKVKRLMKGSVTLDPEVTR